VVPLLHVAVLAALQGLTEALPISGSGHGVAAKLWLDPGASTSGLTPLLHLGTALGLLFAARERFAAALGEGVRAVARPALFRGSPAAHDALALLVGTLVSVVVSAATLPRVEMWAASPTAAGVGLCASGLALASTLLVPRPLGPLRLRAVRPGPSVIGAALIGLAHGLAIFPGASRVGAALTVLLWIGVRPGRAVDLAYLLTVPSLLLTFARGTHGATDLGTLALCLVLAFLGTLVASGGLRTLVERRRLAALALWNIPLGLALLAYAHALPHAV
jgi:undecaprenyl-diphosphatase